MLHSIANYHHSIDVFYGKIKCKSSSFNRKSTFLPPPARTAPPAALQPRAPEDHHFSRNQHHFPKIDDICMLKNDDVC